MGTVLATFLEHGKYILIAISSKMIDSNFLGYGRIEQLN
jgi:hypothetical protein